MVWLENKCAKQVQSVIQWSVYRILMMKNQWEMVKVDVVDASG